nr:hypothetical protein Iba_chr13bCG4500 [Ipomoea batatas]
MVAGDRQGAFGSDESERLYGFAICLALGVACTLLPLENGRRVVNVRTADLGCFLPRDRNWPVCRYRMPVPSGQSGTSKHHFPHHGKLTSGVANFS